MCLGKLCECSRCLSFRFEAHCHEAAGAFVRLQVSVKRQETAGIDAPEPAVGKDAQAIAIEECVNRAEALRKDSNVLTNIWGLPRCEQVEILSGINKTLPHEFQIPYL